MSDDTYPLIVTPVRRYNYLALGINLPSEVAIMPTMSDMECALYNAAYRDRARATWHKRKRKSKRNRT